MENRPMREGCDERFRTIFRRLDEGEARMDRIDERLATIDKATGIIDARLASVVEGLESNNLALKWIVGGLMTQLVAFFFYAVRSGVFGG